MHLNCADGARCADLSGCRPAQSTKRGKLVPTAFYMTHHLPSTRLGGDVRPSCAALRVAWEARQRHPKVGIAQTSAHLERCVFPSCALARLSCAPGS